MAATKTRDVEYPDDEYAPATVEISGRREKGQKQRRLKQNEQIETFRAKGLAKHVDAIWTNLDVGVHVKEFLKEQDEMRNRWRHVYAYLSALPCDNINEFLAEVQ